MRIANRTRNTLLGTRVMRAASFFSRLRGFIGRPEPMPGEGILLVGCNAIHTWWMSFALDVLFLDERGRVLDLVRSLPPRRGMTRARGASYVLEVPVGTIDSSQTEVGDELSWSDSLPYNISILSSQERPRKSRIPAKNRSEGR
jgi:uncharacterized membrane protein (UPF0127 family)